MPLQQCIISHCNNSGIDFWSFTIKRFMRNSTEGNREGYGRDTHWHFQYYGRDIPFSPARQRARQIKYQGFALRKWKLKNRNTGGIRYSRNMVGFHPTARFLCNGLPKLKMSMAKYFRKILKNRREARIESTFNFQSPEDTK